MLHMIGPLALAAIGGWALGEVVNGLIEARRNAQNALKAEKRLKDAD